MSKKRPHEEHENLERWLVSYADFITLLFAFFTILYALSQTDKAKYKNAIESIQRAFMSSGGVFPLRGSPFNAFDKPPDKGSLAPTGPKEFGPFSKAEAEILGKIAEQVRGIFEASTGFSARPDEMDVVRGTEGFKIRIGEAMLFNESSSKLRKGEVGFLLELGKRIAKLGLVVQIEGHADSLEGKQRKLASVTDFPAWELSLTRAYNIMKFMVEGAGVPKEKISIAGYGDSQPLAENDSPEGRARNRRVEFSIITPDHQVMDLDL